MVLCGEIEFTINSETIVASKGTILTIPENALHHGKNNSEENVLLLCVYAPKGLRESLNRKTFEELVNATPIRL
jgi:quercetin dioxygenase-like cupin family protein